MNQPPNNCDNCKSENILFSENSIAYGRLRGDWPYCWYCKNCNALVGCHPNTNSPLGKMANWHVRQLRSELHKLFDIIWKNDYLSRNDAYLWLAKEIDYTNGELHISQLDEYQLNRAILIMTVHKLKGYAQFIRRKEKNVIAKRNRTEHYKASIRKRKSGY